MRDQIDFGNLIKRVFRQWFVILTISIIFSLFLGIVTSRRYRPTYQTEALIVVYNRQSDGSSISAALDATSTFKEIITSNLLQKKIAEELEIPYLPGNLSCEAILNTNMITVRASAETPEDAMIVINGFLEHYDVVTKEVLGNMVLHVLETPSVPVAPISVYNEAKVMIAGLLASIVGISGIIFMYLYFRDDIKNEYHVEKKLDAKLFATIYHEDTKKGFHLPQRNKKKKGLLITNPVTSFGYTETFQKMATRLEYQTRHKDYKTIVITSVQENEGKSTVATNLALALAKSGKRVVLADMDLRKPAVYKLFEIAYDKNQSQIDNVLSGDAKVKDAALRLDDLKMYVLAGNRSYRNSARLLISEHAKHVMKIMRKSADYVIIDTPPISSVVDAEEVMRYADAGLLVVRQSVSKTKDINDSIDIFRSTGCKLLGCILNDVEVGITGNHIFKGDNYNYRYGYGYGDYYGKEKAE